MSLQPLTRHRVLDFTVFPPGALCTVMLADLGAEVIRLEDPSLEGQPSSVFGQIAMSRGKRSMTLDMRKRAAGEVLKRLLVDIDIVVENAKPGTMEARGFGYGQAREVNPRIVWCAITGFGQQGPYAHHPGHDISYLAHSGLLAALAPDLSCLPGIPLALTFGAMAAVVGIQGALLRRESTGAGAFVDISLSEAATWALSGGFDPLSTQPRVVTPSADRRLYPCADGRQVAVACSESRTWSALCKGLGLPELEDRLHRPEHDATSRAAIVKKLADRPAAEWVEHLVSLGAAVTLVNRGSDLVDDPQVRARGSLVAVGEEWCPASPFQIQGADGQRTQATARSAPTVGADTLDVLGRAGFAPGEIEQLRKSAVI